MGSVKEQHLQHEKAGDQCLGRVVSRLDVNDASFAVSTPYFARDGVEGIREKVFELLKDFMVRGHGITGEIFHLLYYCFVTLLSFQFLGGDSAKAE